MQDSLIGATSPKTYSLEWSHLSYKKRMSICTVILQGIFMKCVKETLKHYEFLHQRLFLALSKGNAFRHWGYGANRHSLQEGRCQ